MIDIIKTYISTNLPSMPWERSTSLSITLKISFIASSSWSLGISNSYLLSDSEMQFLICSGIETSSSPEDSISTLTFRFEIAVSARKLYRRRKWNEKNYKWHVERDIGIHNLWMEWESSPFRNLHFYTSPLLLLLLLLYPHFERDPYDCKLPKHHSRCGEGKEGYERIENKTQ